MTVHKFTCPSCKHEWSEEFGFESEVMCPGCETVWLLKFDTFDIWPPTDYWIEGRSDEQPKFELTIDGKKIPGCMNVKVERESFKAHSQVRYWMTAEFFHETCWMKDIWGHGHVAIKLIGHPEVKPLEFRAVVRDCGRCSITIETDGAGYEFACQQMKLMWEKSNR